LGEDLGREGQIAVSGALEQPTHRFPAVGATPATGDPGGVDQADDQTGLRYAQRGPRLVRQRRSLHLGETVEKRPQRVDIGSDQDPAGELLCAGPLGVRGAREPGRHHEQP